MSTISVRNMSLAPARLSANPSPIMSLHHHILDHHLVFSLCPYRLQFHFSPDTTFVCVCSWHSVVHRNRFLHSWHSLEARAHSKFRLDHVIPYESLAQPSKVSTPQQLTKYSFPPNCVHRPWRGDLGLMLILFMTRVRNSMQMCKDHRPQQCV